MDDRPCPGNEGAEICVQESQHQWSWDRTRILFHIRECMCSCLVHEPALALALTLSGAAAYFFWDAGSVILLEPTVEAHLEENYKCNIITNCSVSFPLDPPNSEGHVDMSMSRITSNYRRCARLASRRRNFSSASSCASRSLSILCVTDAFPLFSPFRSVEGEE